MTRSYYDARPSKFEAVGNGSYIYRWDIQEEAAPQQIDPSNQWSYCSCARKDFDD